MLPFELSAIDLILVIAVVVLLILFLFKSSVKPSLQKKVTEHVERHRRQSMMTPVSDLEPEGRERISHQSQAASSECPYGFGYVRKRRRDGPIPDKCLGCSRLIECSKSSE
jgi:hypothetical protein